MERQKNTVATAVLLLEPYHFGYDKGRCFQEETCLCGTESHLNISHSARMEIQALAQKMRGYGIETILVSDNEYEKLPSAVFLSSWIAFCPNSHVVAFPLQDALRRGERRGDILSLIVDKGFPIYDIIDISANENDGEFLHGTEGVIIDHDAKVLYCATSPVAHADVARQLSLQLEYRLVLFSAQGKNTNQVLMLANDYALVCYEAITSEDERALVRHSLEEARKEIIEVSLTQADNFVCSGIQLKNSKEEEVLFLSEQATQALTDFQRERLSFHNRLVSIPLYTIERVGQGSLSSVVAPIFLPK